MTHILNVVFTDENQIAYRYESIPTTTALEYFNYPKEDNAASKLVDAGKEPYLLLDPDLDVFEPIHDVGVNLLSGGNVKVYTMFREYELPPNAIIFWK